MSQSNPYYEAVKAETPSWDGTDKQAEEMYNAHPRMQQLFPTLEDYKAYLQGYNQHLSAQDAARETFAENISNYTPVDYSELEGYDPDFNWQTDYTGPQGIDAIRDAFAGVSTPDAYGMEAAFGNSFAALGSGGGFGGSGPLATVPPDAYGIGGNTYDTFLENQGLSRNQFGSFKEGDNAYVWNGVTFEKRDVGLSNFSKVVRGAVAAGLALGLGPQVGAALGVGSTGALGGAVGGLAGSAISQGITTGSIDAGQLAIAGVTGGITGLAEAAKAGEIAGSALDNAIWDLSGTLGVDYETAANIVQGASTGAVQGGDIEGIVSGAIGNWSTDKLQSFVSDTYGDVIDVDNFFREGTTSIDSEALYPLIESGVNAAIEGGMDPKDALRSTIDYFSEGGSLDFILPGLPQIAEGLDIDLPSLDINFPNIDLNLPDVDLSDLPDVNLDLPDFPNVDLSDLPDVDLNIPEFPDVNLNIPEFPDVNLPDFPDGNLETPSLSDVDLPDVNIPDVNLEAPDIPDPPNLDIEAPDLPNADLETPSLSNVETPDVDLPSLSLPSFNNSALEKNGPKRGSGINYQPLQIPGLISSPQVDYVAELDNIIKRSLFGNMI